MLVSNGSSRRRYRQHGNPFNLHLPIKTIDLNAIFKRLAPIAIDVGCGSGAFTLELAKQHPEWNIVGIEIRQHLVDCINNEASTLGLANIHALLANINLHLEAIIPPQSVIWVSINFPDPWYKKRHQKRRVVNQEWVKLLKTRLVTGAQIHCMTDYQPIAEEIKNIFESIKGFINLDGSGNFAHTTTSGIISERERTHLRRGESIYRLRFCLE
ncbi:MAG: tRNA (guanosine(46)-N7)-methyltransferase TrmB [Deltaproteobacteria bacterium]|nr:tRNA (guanosine(46)-N7)-methyltransferase TrmB [Deltaproteobacteria bacterium]